METIIITTSLLMLATLAGAFIYRKHDLKNVSRKIVIKADTPERFLYLQNAMRILVAANRINGLEIDSSKKKVQFYTSASEEDHRDFGLEKFIPTSSERPAYYHPHSTTW